MTAAPAGWYPDPSGIPNAFRWWDGASWTTAISASVHAPAPLGGVTPAGPAAAGSAAHDTGARDNAAGGTTPSDTGGSVPPDTGAHPGPDFEPAPRTTIPTQPQLYNPVPVAATGMKPWKIAVLFASVLALVLVAGGIYLAMRKGSEAGPTPTSTPVPTSSPQPTPQPSLPSPTVQPTRPSESPQPSQSPQSPQPSQSPQSPQPSQSPQSPQPTPTPQPAQAHLAFTQPATAWSATTDPLPTTPSGPLPQYQSFQVITEPDYNGSSSWVAMMVSLNPVPEWGIAKDQKKGLAAMSTWYQASSFGGAAVTSTTVVDRKFTVDGKSGWMLQQHYTYSIPGLESTGETATFVSVPTGKDTAAVFLSSIPDTDKALQIDANTAIKSLRLVK